MIRVLHFASVINRYDFIDTVLTGLDKSRFQVSALTVVPPTNRTGSYSENEKYESKCLNIDFTRQNYLKIFRALKDEIRRFRPHILQAHHFDETVMGAVAAKTMKVPAFVIGHQYSDHIYVLTGGVKRQAYLYIEKLCNQYADRIVVPTQEVVDLLLKQGVDENKIVRNPYGTDFGMVEDVSADAVEAIREEFELKGKFIALTCCRLNKEKGLDYLLNAIPQIKAKYPSFQLVMVGTGAYEEELKKIQRELQLEESVKFIGWRKDALNWYSLSDVVIQPSLAESFCQVVTESLALRKPIIVTPVGIAPEVIVNGERGGCLVPIADSEAIANAISSLIENPDQKKRLADVGYEFVKNNFSIEKTAQKYEDLYVRMLEEKKIDV